MCMCSCMFKREMAEREDWKERREKKRGGKMEEREKKDWLDWGRMG